MSEASAGGGAWPDAPRWRWPASFAAVLALHALAFQLLRDVAPSQTPMPPQEAVLLDLSPPLREAQPAATPRPADATPVPPPPAAPPLPSPAPTPPAEAVQPLEATRPAEPALATPVPPEPPPVVPVMPEAVLPPPPPPRETRPPLRRAPARRPAAAAPPPLPASAIPSPAPASPPVAAAPSPPAANPSAANAASEASAREAATWASRLAAHLVRFRHYPPDAERRGFTGVAMMRFSVDASGRIVSASLVRGTGHETLDEEAQAWLQRAQPLPPPPPDKVAPNQIVVPFSFVLR